MILAEQVLVALWSIFVIIAFFAYQYCSSMWLFFRVQLMATSCTFSKSHPTHWSTGVSGVCFWVGILLAATLAPSHRSHFSRSRCMSVHSIRTPPVWRAPGAFAIALR